VKYGDQFETLGFQDLIEVKVRSESDLDVRLRNPEYDLTRTIKKVLYGYRGGGDLFASLSGPLHFQGFISDSAALPEPLPALRQELEALLGELAAKSAGRFSFEIADPAAGDGSLAKSIQEQFGFEPLLTSLLDPTPFYFYMVLQSDDRAAPIPIPLPESLDRAGLNRAIEAAIKRFAPGMLRTLALYTPSPAPQEVGMGMSAGNDDSLLQQSLRENFSLRETDLTSGQVPEDTDLLLVIGPEDLDDKQQFAIDQFLMQGGTAILAASSFHVDLTGGSIAARRASTGLEDWLAHQGLHLEPTLVLDPQNTPFPIPVQRDLGGFAVQEIQTLDYPYFPDVRADGLAEISGITSNLGQITLNWSSPIRVDADRNAERQVIELIQSSAEAWTSDSENMQPDFEQHGPLGFARGDDRGRKLLAVAIEGRFQSPFAGKPSPLLVREEADQDSATTDPAAPDESEAPEAKEPSPPVFSGVVESSPPAARLILIGSSSFLTDTAISLASEATQSRYLKPIELIQNAVDWSLEDRGLLTLRGRGQFSRLLEPIGQQGRLFWESLNYLLALGGLALVYWLYRRLRARREQGYASILSNGGTS
jgi:ABC-2 type transport system permease protein